MSTMYATEKQTKILDKIQECEMNICILEDRLSHRGGFPEARKKAQDLLYSNRKKLDRYLNLMDKSVLKGEGVEIENENRPE